MLQIETIYKDVLFKLCMYSIYILYNWPCVTFTKIFFTGVNSLSESRLIQVLLVSQEVLTFSIGRFLREWLTLSMFETPAKLNVVASFKIGIDPASKGQFILKCPIPFSFLPPRSMFLWHVLRPIWTTVSCWMFRFSF